MRICAYVLFLVTGFSFLRISYISAQSITMSGPSVACLNEKIIFENTSPAGLDYLWDFCEGDLTNSVESIQTHNINDINEGADIKTISDDGLFYSFIVDRAANSLHRLDLGGSINNVPQHQLVDLTGLPLTSPQGFDLIKVNDLWYGFIVSSGSNKIYRLEFGATLTGAPSYVELDFQGNLNFPTEIQIARDGGDYFLVVSNFSSNNIVVGRLGSAISNPLESTFNVISLSGASNPYGFGLQKFDDGIWRGIVGSFSNGNFHSVSFNDGLSLLPAVTNITALLPAIVNPVKLTLENWGNENVLFVMTASGNIQRIHFNRGMLFSSVNSFDIVNGASFGSSLSFSTYYNQGVWSAFTFANSTRDLRVLNFIPACNQVNTPFYVGYDSPLIYFTDSGIKDVTLRTEIGGQLEKTTIELNISSLLAPDVDFIVDGKCLLNDVNFTSSVSLPITQADWSFGDLSTSTTLNPVHQYSALGEYEVILKVLATNGCYNISRDTITIYNEPIPNFSLPTASPICTNQEYVFTNTSTFDPGSNPSWQWEVNTTPTSTDQDLAYAITSAVQHDIKLIAGIPGCANGITQSILTVEEGPQANFTFSNGCQDTEITFTNTTVGAVADYSWDFGDGNMSTQSNASNTYTSFGPFDVSLQATNAAGCVSNSIQEIIIYFKPQPDFSIDLPPFSCNGTPSQFNDLTPNPPDSNLDSWAWAFGDAQNGMSSVRNAQYTYLLSGDYNVNLEVTTNFGCAASIQKIVTISESPIADFTFTPACVNQATTFTPAVTSGINSWQWKIGTATYNQQAPTHVFASSNTFNAELTAVHNNGCVAILSKQVSVPVPVTPNFNSTNNCAQQNTIFNDLTPSGSDPVVSRAWEFGTLGSGSGSSASFMFPAAGSYPTKLTVTNASGCSYIISKNVNIASSPIPTFNATPMVGTVPLTVQLANTSMNTISQLWSVNDPGSSTSTAPTPQFTFNELGQYVVDLTVTNPEGCSATTSKIISVIVPSLDLELTSLSLNPSVTGEINLLMSVKNNSNSPITNPKVAIDISGQVIVNETMNVVIQPTQTHTQVLTTGIVEAKGGVAYVCAEVILDGDIDNTNNKLCLSQESKTSVLDPYPNPGSDQMTIEWISDSQSEVDVYIFDPVGRKVYDQSLSNFESGLNRITIPLQVYNPGIYHVLFVSEGVHKSFRYMVRR